MELGGHSPAIIADDANIDNTLDILTGFKFRNAGQVCIAPSRFFIHEKIYNQIADGFIKTEPKMPELDFMEEVSDAFWYLFVQDQRFMKNGSQGGGAHETK